MTTKPVVGSRLIGLACVIITLVMGYMMITRPQVIDTIGLILGGISCFFIFIIGLIMLLMPNIEINGNPFSNEL